MALTAVNIIEVAATGSDSVAGADTNAGTFDPSTNTANYLTDLTTDANTGNTATPVVSSATINFAAGDAKSWLFTIGGASWTLPTSTFADGTGAGVTPTGLWANITSVASNKATLDAAVGHCPLFKTGGPYALNTTAGVSTQATPTAGKGVVDYSQVGTPIVSNTNLASANGTNATPTVTSASRTFDKRDIGNHLYISAGANWTTGIFRITDTLAGGAILDRACGSAASLNTGTFVEGGCLAGPGMAGFFHIAGNKIFLKQGTYTTASATANVTTGVLSLTATAAVANMTAIIGYAAFRGDDPIGATRPTITSSTTTFVLVTHNAMTAAYFLIIDGGGKVSSRGILGSGSTSSCRNYYCSIKNCTNNAITSCSNYFCDATGCTTAIVFNTQVAYYCVAWNNTLSGTLSGLAMSANGSIFAYCMSINTTGGTADGMACISFRGTFLSCLSFGSARDGFRMTASATQEISCINCIAASNTAGGGFNLTAAADNVLLTTCAVYNNGTNIGTNFTAESLMNIIVCTSDPFNNSANGDFGINSTAGGGALLQEHGITTGGFFPGMNSTNFTTGTTTYQSLGPIEYIHSSGGGGGKGTIVGCM